MKRVTSIQIDWYDNGLTCGEFVVHQVISAYRNTKKIIYKGFNAVRQAPQEHEIYPMPKELCEQLFLLIETAEANNEFETDYSVEVCDGSTWEMRIRHSDNTVSLIAGTVEFPTHGKEIERYIQTAIGRAATAYKPLVFGCGSVESADN